MSWSMLGALFGLSPKIVDADPTGQVRIWAAPGILEGRVDPTTGHVFGANSEFLGTARVDLFGDLKASAADGTDLGGAHLDAVGRDHFIGGDHAQLGYAREVATGDLGVYAPDARLLGAEHLAGDQLRVFDPLGAPGLAPIDAGFDPDGHFIGLPEFEGNGADLTAGAFDAGAFDSGAFDMASFDVGAMDAMALGVSDFGFSAMDVSVFDAGAIDLGVFAGGIDPSAFSGFDF